MDWSLFKGVLEGVAIVVVLPAAAYCLFGWQRRQLQEKEGAIRDLRAELRADKEKFRLFSEELVARNTEVWTRIQEEETALAGAAHEQCIRTLKEQFEIFESKLSSVQQELDGFRRTLL
ncbi:MAG: hypothetical protein ACE5IM_07965, partial [Nitrospinota bacterium]